jgi:hypothetical protein
MPRYFCSLPNIKSAGRIPELISDDPVAITAFVKKGTCRAAAFTSA